MSIDKIHDERVHVVDVVPAHDGRVQESDRLVDGIGEILVVHERHFLSRRPPHGDGLVDHVEVMMDVSRRDLLRARVRAMSRTKITSNVW